MASQHNTNTRLKANPKKLVLVLVLIDGDHYHFNYELMKLGVEGGAKAAKQLKEKMEAKARNSAFSDRTCNIVARVHVSLRGLDASLLQLGEGNPRLLQMMAFFAGFNASTPHFEAIDSGEAESLHIQSRCHTEKYLGLIEKYEGKGNLVSLIGCRKIRERYVQHFDQRILSFGSLFESGEHKHVGPAKTLAKPCLEGIVRPLVRLPPAAPSRASPSRSRTIALDEQGLLRAFVKATNLFPTTVAPARPATSDGALQQALANDMEFEAPPVLVQDGHRVDRPFPPARQAARVSFVKKEGTDSMCYDHQIGAGCFRRECRKSHVDVTEDEKLVLRHMRRGLRCRIGANCRDELCALSHGRIAASITSGDRRKKADHVVTVSLDNIKAIAEQIKDDGLVSLGETDGNEVPGKHGDEAWGTASIKERAATTDGGAAVVAERAEAYELAAVTAEEFETVNKHINTDEISAALKAEVKESVYRIDPKLLDIMARYCPKTYARRASAR